MTYNPDGWRVELVSDVTADDSDKSFVVRDNNEWQVLWIWVELTTTAAVGNRQLVVEVLDGGVTLIGQWARAGAVQAASLTRYYLFAPTGLDLEAFRDTNYLSCAMPAALFLKAGDWLRVYDRAAIAPAADDMLVYCQMAQRSIV